MSTLKDSLIKILEQNEHDDFCSSISFSCVGVTCDECVFNSDETKQLLIKELQND